NPLQARLQHNGQLGGHNPCAADIAIFPFVRQFAAVDAAWFGGLPLPALQTWLAGWLGNALFERAMVKLRAGDVELFFGGR
ncbi:MAG: glutathione S-transferase, partial [Hydrogenophaga sp.]|nr:glutathione S-transferase [Hydrogenophaga sp.]